MDANGQWGSHCAGKVYLNLVFDKKVLEENGAGPWCQEKKPEVTHRAEPYNQQTVKSL